MVRLRANGHFHWLHDVVRARQQFGFSIVRREFYPVKASTVPHYVDIGPAIPFLALFSPSPITVTSLIFTALPRCTRPPAPI
jgi:hypothetical protein